MNYREAATRFVDRAFVLLDLYKHEPRSIKPHVETYLDGDYGLRINSHGQLSVVNPNGKLIAHSFNRNCNQLVYIGKLLATYLDYLEKDNC